MLRTVPATRQLASLHQRPLHPHLHATPTRNAADLAALQLMSSQRLRASPDRSRNADGSCASFYTGMDLDKAVQPLEAALRWHACASIGRSGTGNV